MPIRLTVVNGVELLGSTPVSIVVDADQITIGRDPKCDWALPDPTRSMSGTHCAVRPDGRGFRLSDLSTNGTFVNGSAIRMSEDHALSEGDRISIGPYVLQTAHVAGKPSAPRANAATPVAERGVVDARGGDPAAMAPVPQIAEPASMTVIQPARKQGPAAPKPPAPPAGAPSKIADVWSQPVAPPPAEAATPPIPPTPPAAPPARVEQVARQAEPPPVVRAGEAPLREGLARRLGVSPHDLPEGSDADLGLRVLDLLVEFVGGSRKLLGAQNRLRRDLSCRQTMARRMRGGESIALAASDEDAVLNLLASSPDHAQTNAGDTLAALVDESASVGPAAIDAAQAMADLLSPERLSAMTPRQPQSDRWLAAYARLWNDLAPDWDRGFAEAFRLEFGAALDARQSASRGSESGGRS